MLKGSFWSHSKGLHPKYKKPAGYPCHTLLINHPYTYMWSSHWISILNQLTVLGLWLLLDADLLDSYFHFIVLSCNHLTMPWWGLVNQYPRYVVGPPILSQKYYNVSHILTWLIPPLNCLWVRLTFPHLSPLPSSPRPPPTAPLHWVIPIPLCVPHLVPLSTTVHQSSMSSFPPYGLASLSTDFEQDVNMSESSFWPRAHPCHSSSRLCHLLHDDLSQWSSVCHWLPKGSLHTINPLPIPLPPTSHDFSVPSHTWTILLILGIIMIMMLNHLRCITETTMAQRVVPLDWMITTILTDMVCLFPLISPTLESHLWLQANQTLTWTMVSMASTWVILQSLSTMGALQHPISATLVHLSIPLAVSPTLHGEPNTISHFSRQR